MFMSSFVVAGRSALCLERAVVVRAEEGFGLGRFLLVTAMASKLSGRVGFCSVPVTNRERPSASLCRAPGLCST